MTDRQKLTRALKLLTEARKSLELIAAELIDLQQPSASETRATEVSSDGLCTFCEEPILGDEPHFRGAHQRCYKKINRAINSGEINDEQAVRRGWFLPPGRGGRRPGAVAVRLFKEGESKGDTNKES